MISATEAYNQTIENMDYEKVYEKIENAIKVAIKRHKFSTKVHIDADVDREVVIKELKANGYKVTEPTYCIYDDVKTDDRITISWDKNRKRNEEDLYQ